MAKITSLIVLHPYLEAGKTYIVNIKIGNPTEDGKKGINFQGVPAEKVNDIIQEIYKKGFAYRMKETGTIELIHPLNIYQVLIIPEKEKQ